MNKTKDYIYLRAWCQIMGSHDYYLQSQLNQARKDCAPDDVVYYNSKSLYYGDGTHNSSKMGWHRFSDVTNVDTRFRIKRLIGN